MAIIQPKAFIIPDEIWNKLLSGDLIQFGGVVRDTSGRIVTHLKEVPLPKVRDYKNYAIGLGVVAVLAVTGLVIVTIKTANDKKKADRIEPKCVSDYNVSLATYLDAIKNRRVDTDCIARLIADLDTLKELCADGKISIEFSLEQLKDLLNLVYNYTKELAEVNNIELHELTAPNISIEQDNITNLHYYLNIQKQIFEKSA
jgi:hypothetical protein